MRYLLLLSLITSCSRTDLLPEETSDMGGRQDLFIPLGKGLRTDIAADLLPVGANLEVENMQFDLTGSLIKRFGHLAQSLTTQPAGGTISPTWQLATHKGTPVSFSQQSLLPISIYSPNDIGWNTPTTDRVSPLVTSINKIKSGGNNPRMAYGNGFYYLLYLDLQTSGLMHFDVVDAKSGHVSVAQTFLAGGVPVFGYDVIFCNGFAVAVTAENGVGVVFRRMSPTTKTFTTTTFAATFASQAFDAIQANGTTISVVYANNTAQAAGVDFVPSTLTTTGFAIRDSGGATISLDLGRVSWIIDLGVAGKVGLATVSTTQGVRGQWDLSSGATRTATTTFLVDPGVIANIGQITAFTTTASAGGSFIILYTVTATPITNNFTKWGGAISGVTFSGSVLFRSLTLLSKPWTSGGMFFAMFAFPGASSGDANNYVMRIFHQALGSQPSTATPQAIFSVGTGGNVDQFGSQNLGLTRVLSLSATQFITSVSYLNRVGQQADSFFSAIVLGIQLVTVTHFQPTDIPTTGHPIEAADSLLVPGGRIGQFDGITYSDMGFSYAPTAPGLVQSAGGGLTTGALYWYVLVYSYMDAQGRLWRSGTSEPTSVQLTGGNATVTVACPTLRITGRRDVSIEIYRGGANSEALFQKLGSLPNDITVDTVSFVDTFSDTQLAIGEELYTGENGNAILNNDTIPGSTFLWTYGNRIFFISADDPTELWFSNVISPGNGVRFNSQNIVRIADSHGGVIAAESLEDKVIAIKGDAVYAFNGQGPDDAGNGSFPTPQIVALGIGTANPRSVVSMKDGVFFDSTAARPGMQMIDRGLSIAASPDGSPFAAAVERYAAETIMSAILIPEQSQVRFYCASGRVLVYDLVSKMWATFLINTNGHSITSATASSGAALISLNDGEVWLEDKTAFVYTDNGLNYGVRIASPWISVDGIKGFERVIQLIGVGKTIGDHTLDVQMYKDFDDTAIVNEKTWALTVANNPLWNWEWNRPRVARMSAEKLVLLETSSGAGFRVEGVSETLGLRSGLARQPTSTRGP